MPDKGISIMLITIMSAPRACMAIIHERLRICMDPCIAQAYVHHSLHPLHKHCTLLSSVYLIR